MRARIWRVERRNWAVHLLGASVTIERGYFETWFAARDWALWVLSVA